MIKTFTVLAAAVLLVTVIPLQGCSYSQPVLNDGKRLEFEPIDATYLGNSGCTTPQLIALASKPTLPEKLNIISKQFILSVDYSKYFVLSASYGFTSVKYSGIIITDIWQKENQVYVRAQFYKPHADNYVIEKNKFNPALSVKVNKENLMQYGKITFILLDDYLIERARTSAVIHLPAGVR